jgi:hypothetical protein
MKSKIVLEQHGATISPVPAGKAQYDVVALHNRTRPLIGETLTEEDVKKLLADARGNLTVEIKPSKKRR